MSDPKLRYTLSQRPRQAPEGWRIFNAPRPLYGTLRNEDGQVSPGTWDGDFLHGTFYAAVDPADPNADMWVGNNAILDAQEIQYITEQQAYDVGLAYYQTNYPDELAEIQMTEKTRKWITERGYDLLNAGEAPL